MARVSSRGAARFAVLQTERLVDPPVSPYAQSCALLFAAAAKYRIFAIYQLREFAQAGGLMS